MIDWLRTKMNNHLKYLYSRNLLCEEIVHEEWHYWVFFVKKEEGVDIEGVCFTPAPNHIRINSIENAFCVPGVWLKHNSEISEILRKKLEKISESS